jgi:glycine oxidase
MASPDVVIVGGGIVGMVTAYYLAKAGVPSVVVERDAISSHASGFAYGGLSPSLIAWCWRSPRRPSA